MELRRNEYMTGQPVLYIDMDGPLVDMDPQIAHCTSRAEIDCILSEQGFFLNLPPTLGSYEAVQWLIRHFDTFLLSTSMWENPFCGMEKRLWVDKHLPQYFHKRLITSHFKNLNIGDYLIDDRTKNGAGEFLGELILFGSPKFPDWPIIIEYLAKKIKV